MTRPVIHRVWRGHAPNCSASGSVVGTALLSAVAVAAVLNAYADRFARWLSRDAPPPDGGPPTDGGPPGDEASAAPPDDHDHDPEAVRVRLDGDRARIAWPDPPALLEVDAATAEAALARGATRIGRAPGSQNAPTPPTEVHVALTDRCPVACDGCYLDAGPDRGDDDPGVDDVHATLDGLADLGVFEVAFGGGEGLLRADVAALARHARRRGLTPNLTTTGFGLTVEQAEALAGVCGQVNVSLDGLDETYAAVRGWAGARVGLRAVERLVAAGARVGVNTVLSRRNWDTLDALADALVAAGVSEWQWLRFKPAGRGVDTYGDHTLTPAQALAVWPRLLALEARTGLVMRIDCALVPFLVAHAPDPVALERLGVTGCHGGDRLWSRAADGAWHPCSFAHGLPGAGEPTRAPPHAVWGSDPTLTAWRARAAEPPDPCSSCAYRAVCRGGCRIVAHHATGDALAPDPECPRVRAWADAP